MKITAKQLQEMVNEAISAKLAEGAKEISIRMVLGDIKDVVVDSITEDLMRELGMDEQTIKMAVGRAFDKMAKDIVLELDKPQLDAGLPRRRVVAVGS